MFRNKDVTSAFKYYYITIFYHFKNFTKSIIH